MAIKNLVVVGAGGGGREIKWLIQEINEKKPEFKFLGFLLSDMKWAGPRDSSAEVLGDFGWLERKRKEVDAIALGIGTPSARTEIGSQVETDFPDLEWPVLIHPSVKFDRSSSRLGRGIILGANAVGTVNLKLDDYCWVNLSCTIGHEVSVGVGSVLHPGANISGGVNIGRSVLVGTGAQILNYLNIGDESVIGAGAVVIKDIPPRVTAFGVPARVVFEGGRKR